MPVLDAPRGLAAAVLIGLLLGILSSFGDAAGITVVNALANAAGPWIVAAFFAGALQGATGRGALAGLLALGAATAVYYGRFAATGAEFPAQLAVAWLALSAVVGPLAGLGGAAWSARVPRWGTFAVVALAGALLAEAAHRLVLLEAWDGLDPSRTYAQLAIADVVLALGLVALLLERSRWALAALGAPVVAAAGLGVLVGVDLLFDRLLDPGA